MALIDWFDRMSNRDAETFTDSVIDYFTSHQRRHADLVDRLDLLIGALGAGLRAAGETLERGPRRR